MSFKKDYVHKNVEQLAISYLALVEKYSKLKTDAFKANWKDYTISVSVTNCRRRKRVVAKLLAERVIEKKQEV